MEDRNHEVVRILEQWKAAVPLAVDDAGRARQKELADQFLAVRYRDGIHVTVTTADGRYSLEVLSLGEHNGRLYVVPRNGCESLFRDDANDPRVVRLG